MECVEHVLANVCPNCGGGFEPRPVRPSEMLARHPASEQEVRGAIDADAFAARRARYERVPPHER